MLDQRSGRHIGQHAVADGRRQIFLELAADRADEGFSPRPTISRTKLKFQISAIRAGSTWAKEG